MKMLQRVEKKTLQLSMMIKKPIKLIPCEPEPQYLSSSVLKELYRVQGCSHSKPRQSLLFCITMLTRLGPGGLFLRTYPYYRVSVFSSPSTGRCDESILATETQLSASIGIYINTYKSDNYSSINCISQDHLAGTCCTITQNELSFFNICLYQDMRNSESS